MSAGVASERRRRVRARVEGTVQGVGFRPFAFRLAEELGLRGWVRNDARGVILEVEGAPEAVEGFLARLPREAPPLAAVERVAREDVPATGAEAPFRILASAPGAPAALVAADVATCEACLAELLDPADRRFRYPFINCTDCGPRFTIVNGAPYDRRRTTMAGFAMCARCRAEYEDPRDRRFHAQPNACPDCGPAARLRDASGAPVGEAGAPGEGAPADAVAAAARALRAGAIVAVKGMGGYHLACLAGDGEAVARLRARKHREDKPFALLAADLPAARRLVVLDEAAERLLVAGSRPIVLARRRPGAAVASAVAPRAGDLGVMLPYSPLHHLLARDAGEPLVLTSGNVSDEPIAYRDEDALERLSPIADRFLLHDRPIRTRTDDSVVRAARPPVLVRRSRGMVPEALSLPVAAPRPLLACGAELKATFCLARGDRAWVGPHVGDLTNHETLRSYEEGIAHFRALFDVAPAVAAHDLHPDYLSTAHARATGLPVVAVQHHHAHLAAVLAEHGELGRAAAAVFDGTGLGTDGTVWGGELLVGDLRGFARAGHLWPVRLPGGERAVREPWRMACAWLAEGRTGDPALPPALAGAVSGRDWRNVLRLARTGLASPVTTSAGRLFDAAAALCGVRARATYEGQAAAELESVADPRERDGYPIALRRGAAAVIDPRETLRALSADVAAGVPAAVVSARFHNALARATADACTAVADRHGTETVVLSGGAFQNRLLVERTAGTLRAAGLRVLLPERLPPNDGGIAYGQAAVAAARLAGPA